MKKLPTINAQYWAFIISATTLGETGGDLISQSLHLGYAGASILLIALFIIALLIELKTAIQHPLLYWLVIILASLAGTTISDFVTRTLGLGYGWGSLLVATVLVVIFYCWHKMTKHVSVQSAFNVKTECLYWTAILASSTLGTAFGDYIANATPLGFGGGALLLMSLLVIIMFLALLTQISREIFYWLAIIITHPMGAALGDFMTKPEGINLGNVPASAILLVIFVLIMFSFRTKQM
ncbi:MAG TPA: hypothetical protein VES38_10635 [Methylotenera sp.]|nr:hypothetical protein [Methylotenera sp.]